jgi:hypothetical protein
LGAEWGSLAPVKALNASRLPQPIDGQAAKHPRNLADLFSQVDRIEIRGFFRPAPGGPFSFGNPKALFIRQCRKHNGKNRLQLLPIE